MMKTNYKLLIIVIISLILIAYVSDKSFEFLSKIIELQEDISLIKKDFNSHSNTLSHRELISKILIDRLNFLKIQLSQSNLRISYLEDKLEKELAKKNDFFQVLPEEIKLKKD